MWTKKGTGTVIIGVSLIFLSFILENLALLNLGTIFLAFVAVNLFFSGRSISLEINRSVDQEKVFEGGLINVTLSIKNRGVAVNYLEVFDDVPRELKIIGGSNHAFLRLGSFQTRTLRYTVKGSVRGYYYFKDVKLRRRDLFSQSYTVHNYEKMTFVAVFPKVSELTAFAIRSHYPRIFQGVVVTRKIGEGSSFHSIRDYVAGDPYKKINWKAFGRTQELMVNEYEREDLLDVMVVVESTKFTAIPNMADNPIDYSARAAASVANFFINRRDNVGLCVYGKSVNYIPHESGEKQFQKILNTLASMYPRGMVRFSSVAEIVIRHFTPKSPVIIISSLVSDGSLVEGIRSLVAHGFEVVCISPDISIFLSRISDIDAQIILEERQATISKVQGYGALVMDWSPHSPIEEAVMKGILVK